MTKARDLAGFSTSSITNTATDGLVLAGDGSSTDVVIKNGANATVASIPDGSTNLSVTGSVTGALARGAIQVGDSSGVAAALAKGTSGYVLTAGANDLSWAAAGGGLEFIASSGAISNEADVEFTSKIDDSKYDSYKFFFHSVIPATDGAGFGAQLSADNGSNYETSGYHKIEGFTQATSDLSYLQVATSMDNGAGGGYSGEGQLFNAGSSSSNTLLTNEGISLYNSGTAGDFRKTNRAGSYVASTAAHTAIKFLFTSGNIASGEITMFGVVNS